MPEHICENEAERHESRAAVLEFILVTDNGIVLDEAGQPMRDASIALRNNTDGPNIIGPPFDGRFVFAVVEGGKYSLTFEFVVNTLLFT